MSSTCFSARGIVGPDPKVSHARPLDEPLLWIPDIVAGAIYTALDGDPRYRTTLKSLIEVYDIELT